MRIVTRGNRKQFIPVPDRIHLAAQRMIHPGILDDRAVVRIVDVLEHEVSLLALQLDSYVAGMPEKRIDVEEKWPADWWQAIKDRWFPEWLLSRWPVRYKTVSIHETIYKAVYTDVSGMKP